ncbi:MULTISPECIES: hypothetical protein [Flavobacterium]|uniref:hypothetical protein n=1 Tax=Flavobacterium TaxID=237 RepID=UPI001FCC9EB5|nr:MULTISPECIES: hypothetical protein [Flavobacterium]UOK42164.1 hypothetical protein LZF87_12700 [Flavobacterium enshiense]
MIRNKISKIILLVLFAGTIFFIIKGYMMKYDTENLGKMTIGKYVSHDGWGKGDLNYFVYYVKGKKIRANGGRAPQGFSNNIGKFYRIQYSQKYISINAFFDQEVTDSIEILKAGFSEEDIKLK